MTLGWRSAFKRILDNHTVSCITFSAIIFCFCNSPSCLQAVCESKQRCFTQLVRKSGSHGNVSTSVVYGCSEELNSNSTCAQSSRVVCCDKQLCNMPNILRSEYLTVVHLHDHTRIRSLLTRLITMLIAYELYYWPNISFFPLLRTNRKSKMLLERPFFPYCLNRHFVFCFRKSHK